MARTTAKSSFNALHSAAYRRFVKLLIDRRDSVGLKQQQIADRLGWNQSVIAKIETVQRRADFMEVILLAECIGFDAAELVPLARAILAEEGDLPAGD